LQAVGSSATPRAKLRPVALIYQPHQRRSQFCRLKTERTRLRLVSDPTLGVDGVKAIWPTGIDFLRGIAEFVDQCGDLDAELPYTRSRNQCALCFIFRTGKNNFVLEIALHLPNVARVRFRDIYDEKIYLVLILLVELVESGNLPPEWRSSVAAKDENDRVTLRRQAG
jgi:hypothetical protein